MVVRTCVVVQGENSRSVTWKGAQSGGIGIFNFAPRLRDTLSREF